MSRIPSCERLERAGTPIKDDPRVKKALGMLQIVWNLSYSDVKWVGVYFGACPQINREDQRPPLHDYECQWLAIWFPWSWVQIREVFPKIDERLAGVKVPPKEKRH